MTEFEPGRAEHGRAGHDGTGSDDSESGQAGLIERFQAAPGRYKALLLLAIVLVVLAATGRLQASSGIEIERDEAVEIARSELDFEPERADARIIRQGFALRPVWAVSFSIPTPGGENDQFDRLMIVEVDAISGEIRNVTDESVETPSG